MKFYSSTVKDFTTFATTVVPCSRFLMGKAKAQLDLPSSRLSGSVSPLEPFTSVPYSVHYILIRKEFGCILCDIQIRRCRAGFALVVFLVVSTLAAMVEVECSAISFSHDVGSQ